MWAVNAAMQWTELQKLESKTIVALQAQYSTN